MKFHEYPAEPAELQLRSDRSPEPYGGGDRRGNRFRIFGATLHRPQKKTVFTYFKRPFNAAQFDDAVNR